MSQIRNHRDLEAWRMAIDILLAELDTQLEIVVRLNYCSGERTRHIEDLLGTERKMLIGLRRALGRQLLVVTGVPAMLLLIGLRVW